MRLLEVVKWTTWPEGGASIPSNFSIPWHKAVAQGTKEIELDSEEMLGFLKLFLPQIPADIHVVDDNFSFWGVKIKRLI